MQVMPASRPPRAARLSAHPLDPASYIFTAGFRQPNGIRTLRQSKLWVKWPEVRARGLVGHLEITPPHIDVANCHRNRNQLITGARSRQNRRLHVLKRDEKNRGEVWALQRVSSSSSLRLSSSSWGALAVPSRVLCKSIS